MSSNAKQESENNQYVITCRAARAALLVLVVLAALIAMAETAEAAGVPTQIIVFTDKKVYSDAGINPRATAADGFRPDPTWVEGENLRAIVYAIVLDDDGNIMKGTNGSISGNLNDVKILSHAGASARDTTTHHTTIINNPNYVYVSVSKFNDSGTTYDNNANDGINAANFYIPDFSYTDPFTWNGSSFVYSDAHILLQINVTYSGSVTLTKNVTIMVSPQNCHNGDKEEHSGVNKHDATENSGLEPCTMCHWGYDHQFNTNKFPEIPLEFADIHIDRIIFPSGLDAKGTNANGMSFHYNTSYDEGTTWTTWGAYEPSEYNASKYCYVCHYATSGGSLLEYNGESGTARSDPSERPSCSVGSKSLSVGTVACHATTKLEGSAVPNWSQAMATTDTTTDNLLAVTTAVSHNHSTPKPANVSCAICHGTVHNFQTPNKTASTINNQCVLCHNITGGLNITANGGSNIAHDGKTDCKACHMDSGTKLDAHLVPTAEIPNANCTLCHDLGGKAPYHIDFKTFNKSSYVHNQYNMSANPPKYPLNYNASNGNAVRAADNKICWGCHGEDDNNDGHADFSEQPTSDHPNRYKNPRTCENCHQNASSPWDAPQNVAHSNNTNEVRTPGAPNCYDCHGQPVMYNNSHEDPDFNHSYKATLAYHYGTGFPELADSRGRNGYCVDFCHQNTSSPFELEFYNKMNMQRPNHSAMTSRPQNQSCRTPPCHAADKIHDEKMRKPTLAAGTFNDSSCLESGCHGYADTGINYSFHNGSVNCTYCHMDKKGENIHPIKYLQLNGWDFAQVNITAGSCKLCHKNSEANTVLARWGVTAKKVGSQHHSEDPKNGSKWNKTIDPFWDYVPQEITFVNGWVNSSGRGFMTNFSFMNDTNVSAARISENTTADAYVGIHPSNHEFNSTVQAGGWYSNGTATTKAWSELAEDGNPSGGIIIASTTKSQVVDATWSAQFEYNKSGDVAMATIKLDSKLVKASNINTGAFKAITAYIDDKAGNVTTVYNRTLPNTAETDWNETGELSIPNNATVFWKNGSSDHLYNVTIRARWTGLGGGVAPDIKVAFDNIYVNISEVDYKKYNFTFYINNTPNSDNLYNLIIGYQTHTEPAKLYVLNGSNFQFKAALDSGAFTKLSIPITKQEYNNGNVTLRINDSNGPGETPQEVDVHADYIDIEYMFIESYQWVNNSRLHYPCEYCHASNKHFQHALGIPYEFKGNNEVNSSITSTSNWCSSCHYQGYVSGGKTYADTVQAFLSHVLPVPPEITGHPLYGVNDSINSAYYEHSSLGNFNDSKCFECHRGGLAADATSTVFMHNASKGTSGGRNCTACHNVSGPQLNVNFTSVNKSMHGNLNRNATGNATNKPCWGCHGTLNGLWANETDQAESDHNGTYYNKPRKCEDCHNSTNPLFNAKPVTDHIPSGQPGTDVNTSKYNKTHCAYCHNNSIGDSFDLDGLGLSIGGSVKNASSAHYGANRTKGKLMTSTNSTTDCVYCHRNGSNMVKWGIILASLSNISNKNGTVGTGYNHNAYNQSSQCYTCHGGTVANFHVSAMSPGEKGNPDCASCHNISSPGSYLKVDFAAINLSVHGNLNNRSSSSAGNVTNKPCWGCHGTKTGLYANYSDQPANDHNSTFKSSPRKCEDCHINGTIQFAAPGLTEHIMPGRNASTEINVTDGYCSVCHNNSITSNGDADGMGILNVVNASSAHYAKDANANLMTTTQHSKNCTYCHFIYNGSSAWLTPRKPLTSTHSSYDNSTPPSTCWGCHVDYSKEVGPSTFHSQEVNKGTGSGPNCRSCHNISDPDPNRGHIDSSVFNASIHGNMNTTAGVDLNEPCWGCHGNGNSEGHNTTGDAYARGSFKNPYNCTDCHISTGIRFQWALARGALNVSEHFTNGNDIRASYNATVLYSCLKCHQDISEMRQSNGDTDTNRTVWVSGGDNYNNTIGGNNSPYHYGRKRADMRTGINTSCGYCHQNSSSAFPLTSTNKTIFEHSDTGTRNITGRECTDAGCHDAGYIHNLSLKKPAVQNWTLGKYDYCAPCHRENGISTKKIRGHNTSNISTPGMDCSYCHNVSSQGQTSQGALRIHSPRLANRSVSNSSCADCHRDTNYVPAARMIRTHYPGATTDKGNTSESGRTCELCHGEVAANKLHQVIVKKPNYNCASCHQNGNKTSPYNATTAKASINSFLHDNASHAPTNQSGCERCHNTTGRAEYFHFTNYANGTSAAPGWASWNNGTQANCIDCHRNNTNQPPFYALFSTGPTHTQATLDGCYNCHTDVPTYASDPKELHYVVQSPGNANCTLCHDIGGEASKEIDVSAMNRSDSIHLDLNKNAVVVKAVQPYANDSKRCWACHGNGSEPDGHPTNYKNAYKCIDCHVPSGGRNTNYSPNNTILNVTEHYNGGSDIRVSAASYCTSCHNKTEMLITNSDTALSGTNPANDSVSHYGKKRSDIRTGMNTSCAYCHQNSTTAFENVMMSSLNKSISEHTNNAPSRNTTAGDCAGGECHASGFLHNSTLTKPSVQIWTAGSKDYCAPCHKVSDAGATKYVYAHNTTNISLVGMDCGYCHNASSQGVKSSGALKLHTGKLTNTSTSNSTCVSCHGDAKYVTAGRVIRTHYPGAASGKANTTLSTWDCEECHGWTYGTKMHSSGLVKKPAYGCNDCHNASGTSPYRANATPLVNITRHDNASHNTSNIINCNWCHNNTNRPEPFHFTSWSNGTVEAPGWAGWVNGTRTNCTNCHVTYNNTAPFYAEPGSYPGWHKGNYGSTLNDCYQCHSNLTVLNSSETKVPVEIHNVTRSIDWNDCNACHASRYGGAPVVDNQSMSGTMHAGIDGATASNINPACKACHGGSISLHKNSSANNCTYCHITDRTKYGAKNVSEHILNGTYTNTSVNTSRYQQVFCNLCHNNSLASFNDDTPGTGNATTAHYGQNKTAGKLMSAGVNSTDCLYCHKNASNMAKWGILSTSKANISNRGDHKDHSTNAVCYDCHVDTKAKPATFHAEELNQGVGSSPNCIGCHNTGSTNKKVDFQATNDSSNIHKNLNSGANAQGYDSANKPCWECHGNGTATGHINTSYKSPRICESCHLNASYASAPQVREHFWNGSDIKATNATNNSRSCLACHQNISEMLLANNDSDAGTFDSDGDGVNGTGISAYHYGKKRNELRSGVNTSCIYCHQNSSSAFPLSDSNKSIMEHTSSAANITDAKLTCTNGKCHAAGFIHNSTLTKPAVAAWTAGSKDYCAPCHKPGDAGAARYVYNQSHDPANYSSYRIGDCGYCHNSSSQGINGSTLRVHTPALTNSTTVYASCSGCHNGTSLYVGASNQIFSHMPNASQYRGNTSTSNYDCKSCHNMSGKPSMHSYGMDSSNGTCDTCHFSRTSPFKANKTMIAANDYNHSYSNQKTCNISMCHNASGAALGFHLDRYAAGIVADPERVNIAWNNKNNYGFTDTPYVDCIDCHRELNNTYPFTNAVHYEANITGENKKNHTISDSMDQCYSCHTNRTTATDRFMVHNVTIEPLEGGPACVSCHNLSAPTTSGFPSHRVNHTALNQSIHKNLTNSTAWNNGARQGTVLLDSACWACHASNINEIPNNAHPDRGGPSSLKAISCPECHTTNGYISMTNPQVYNNATKVYKHYPGAEFASMKRHTANYTDGSCQVCHNNSIVYNNVSITNLNSTVSHYALKTYLEYTKDLNSCENCHYSSTVYGNPKQLANNFTHSMGQACQAVCHNPDYRNLSYPDAKILHNASLGVYFNNCYFADCHKVPSGPPRGGR